MDKSEKTIIIVVVSAVAGCLLIAMFCAGIFLISEKLVPAVPTPAMPTPAVCTIPLQESMVLLNVDEEQIGAANETQDVLANVNIPYADLNVITARLTGRSDIQTHLTTPPIDYEIGDELDFYKLNEDDENILTTTTLRYETDTVYFWAEEDIVLDEYDLNILMDIFANEIYPTNQAFFGTEWIPGVDNDPHLYIVYASGLGEDLAGYAASWDNVLTETQPYSNVHEVFFINADVQSLNDLYTLSTMAHEFQHVIHGYRDPNEELWLNESFSELSTLINGYDAGGFDYLFSREPDMQLNDWSPDSDLNDLNYGASYLFSTYLLSRFGETITRAVVNDPLNGLSSLDNVFASNGVVDPLTGITITADEFFRDWTLANYLNDPDLLDGRYYYTNYPEVPTVDDTQWLGDCDGTPLREVVHQYGTDYYEIGCSGIVTLRFTGDAVTGIMPDGGENSSFVMWSNRADASDMTLTKEFDLTGITGGVSFGFDTWYDLESDFDYVYLMASVDGGAWQILESPSCTTLNPNGNNYGCGYNGQTYNWQYADVDLSQFAGRKVALRFEYITDGALSTEGFAIDNLSIPEIGYTEDFEEGSGGWSTEGFARMRNSIPQTFLVSLISPEMQEPIRKYEVEPGEELNLVIDPKCYETNPILVVSGASRFTRQVAHYTITLTE